MRSALCKLQSSDGSAQCSGHIAHNVNSLRAEAVSRARALLESLGNQTSIVSEIKQEDPLNLSISLSGGREINRDCLSTGEGSGKSPDWKSFRRIVI